MSSRSISRRVLVTGPNGFIGRHLIPHLTACGMVAVSSRADVRRPLRSHSSMDTLVHLAGKTRDADFHDDPRAAYESNLLGTMHALEFCKRTHARLICMSTAGVYGNQEGAIRETCPCDPLTTYAESKWMAERMCVHYAQHHGVNVVILRVFNVYGPGQQSDHMIPEIVSRIMEGKPIVLRNPKATRDFVHVRDVARAIERAILTRAKGVDAFNIGCGKSVAMEYVVQRALKLSASDVAIRRSKARTREILTSRASIAKAKRSLKWQPSISLDQGLRELLDARNRA